MDKYFEQFMQILSSSVESIDETYIRFEAVGLFDGFMERTYSYELYHQLRYCQEQHKFNDFIIHAEPEKCRTFFFEKLIKKVKIEVLAGETEEEFQKRVMPDLLVHIPGNKDANIAIVEVKPERGLINKKGFTKDIEVLKQFTTGCEEARGYHKGVELLFNTAAGFNDIEKICDEYGSIIKQTLGDNWADFTNNILLMWHPGPKQALINIDWSHAK
jgi:hypothetical protein